MDAMNEDVTTMTDAELAAKAASIEAERTRRAIVTDAERRTDEMCLELLTAGGRENGGVFEQPTGLVGAYPRGWRVIFGARAFEAVVPGATTAPPGDGWTEVDPATELTPFWQPGTAYDQGARVRDAGRVWEAIADDTDGARPSEFPGGWTLIS